MGADKKTAAFFDFGGTLFQRHFWLGVVRHHVKHKVRLPQVSTYIATHIPLWLASKFKILGEETCKVRWGEDLATAFKGASIWNSGFNQAHGHCLKRITRSVDHKGKAYGIDISPAMLKVTKRRLEEVQVIDRVELYCGGVPRRVAQPFRLFLWTSTISMKVSTLAFHSASE